MKTIFQFACALILASSGGCGGAAPVVPPPPALSTLYVTWDTPTLAPCLTSVSDSCIESYTLYGPTGSILSTGISPAVTSFTLSPSPVTAGDQVSLVLVARTPSGSAMESVPATAVVK